MKNLLTLLLFVCVWVAGATHSSAQIRSGEIVMNFKDPQGTPFTGVSSVYVRNTDSVGFPGYPYLQGNPSLSSSNFYDSFSWDSSFHDTLVTVHYYACGQWFTIDTFFSILNLSFGQFAFKALSVTVPCFQPCNADFHKYAHSLAFKATVHAYQKGSHFHHHWDFGDGHTDTLELISHQYLDSGTYTILHIITNDESLCTDTVWKTVQYAYNCDAHFNTFSYGNAKQQIRYAHESSSVYHHIWDLGDGTIRTDSAGYFIHDYGIIDSFTIKHIVYVPGQCSDTFSRTIMSGVVNCNFGLSKSVTAYTVTITPTITNAPFIYNMGDGNNFTKTGSFQHTYMGYGTYQITMQDVSQNCSVRYYNTTINPSGCWGNFHISQTGPFTMYFYHTLTEPGTRIIYFGNGDSVIGDTATYTYPNTSGYYTAELVIVDGAGNTVCRKAMSFDMNACGNTPLNWRANEISGGVRFNNVTRNDYDSLMVYLILHDSVNATLTAIDSTVIYNDSGYFHFYDICYPAGTKFLVKAALLPGSSIYTDFLPTYADTSVLWSGGKKITLAQYASINMRPGTNPGGPGFIGGYISQGANKNGAALDGIQVTLLRSDGAAVAYVLSENAGRYEFHNLAYGSYRVLVEIPGKPSQEYAIVLNSANESFDNLDFEVNTMDITTKMTSVQGAATENLKLYPNPADHSLFIEWTGGQATVEMLDINGKTWLRTDLKEGSGTQKIDVSSLSPGFYFIRINDGNEIRHQLISIR